LLRADLARAHAGLGRRRANDGIVRTYSAKELCALHPNAYAPLPARRTAPYEWAPGDFSVHLAALPLARRIELAREYARRLNLV
jgi:hypothetical protein